MLNEKEYGKFFKKFTKAEYNMLDLDYLAEVILNSSLCVFRGERIPKLIKYIICKPLPPHSSDLTFQKI